MEIFHISLLLATFLCSIVAGFLFAFAVVVMPGIKNLGDTEFIRAFQVIDGVIQNNQPIFMLVWVGSILILIFSIVLSIGQMDGIGYLLVIFAALTYFLGVQLPTFINNIPLNNKLQTLNVDTMSKAEQKLARENFELRWNRWNSVRAVLSSLASALLIFQLFRFCGTY